MTLRPLDPLRSIKVKLGVLVAASVAVASLLVWYGLTGLGWWPRYTLPVAVLAALGVTQLLARGMTSPLRSMTAAARAMARGDYSRRVHTASRDEVGELAAAFNRMAADLEAADTSRREMIANVSHELRTPITALQAILENVVDGVAEPDPATLRLALAQTERLGRLVRELLDLSRIDAGSHPLNRNDLPVADVVRAANAEASLGAGPGSTCGTPRTSSRPTCGRTPTRTACARCSPTCSTTRRGTAPTAGPSWSGRGQPGTACDSRSSTRDRACRRPNGSGSSTASTGRRPPTTQAP